ncbi:MAG: hypothetical protein AAFY20_26160 [Cyanobacteria bacterium J06639_14]
MLGATEAGYILQLRLQWMVFATVQLSEASNPTSFVCHDICGKVSPDCFIAIEGTGFLKGGS